MEIRSRIIRLCVVTLILSFTASAYAANRNEVFSELNRINTNWDEVSVDLWINDFENDLQPGVLVGDELIYRVKSNKPAFFTFILVDARGNMAVLKPDALPNSGINGASQNLTFPTEEQSQSGQSTITQAMPLGKETIFLLATDQQIPADVFGLDPSTDFVSYGSDLSESRDLAMRLNDHSNGMKVELKRYEYFVDSDTQFSTRSIRREISARVGKSELTAASVTRTQREPVVESDPVVINDIRFDYNSDVLTIRGINQLEVLGSELIDLQQQNQLPRIRLTGHTDSVGSADYNLDLSKRRSLASKRFLVDELGLPEEFIETNGMGEAVEIEDNSTDSGRARNRRVEFEIIR